MRITLTSILCLTSGLAAQQASYTYVDQLPPYTNPVTPYAPFGPLLRADTLPVLGGILRIEVPRPSARFTDCPYRAYYLLTGLVPRLFDTAVLGPGFRGWLFTTPDLVLRPPRGGSSLPNTPGSLYFGIPNDVRLLGARFYQQIVALEFYGPICSRPATTWAASRGGIATIGR